MNRILALLGLFTSFFLAAATAHSFPVDPVVPVQGGTYNVGQPIIFAPDPTVLAHSFWSVTMEASYSRGNAIEAVIYFDRPTTQTITLNVAGDWSLETWGITSNDNPIGGQTIIHVVKQAPLRVPEPVYEEAPASGTLYWDHFYPGGGNFLETVTLDNSFSKFMPIRLKNDGVGPLVLKGIYMAVGFDYLEGYPINFVPYTVLQPGEERYLVFRVDITDVQKFIASRHRILVYVLESTDPNRPIRFFSSGHTLTVFDTVSSIPPGFALPLDPPTPIPPTPCGDTNGDYRVDSADTLESILRGEK